MKSCVYEISNENDELVVLTILQIDVIEIILETIALTV